MLCPFCLCACQCWLTYSSVSQYSGYMSGKAATRIDLEGATSEDLVGADG